MRKIAILSFSLLLMWSANAQTMEGDAVMDLIGTKTGTPSAQKFIAAYDIQNKTDAIYTTTKNGIDMRVRNDSIVSITLYKDNPIYGAFSNKLPKGISFDQTSADIVKNLGKPATEYMNSGYNEYHFGNVALNCWFENGVLRRVTVSLL